MEQLKKTALFNSYEKYGGKIIDFAGWALPVQFEGIIPEHEAVRRAAGLFDVSHMGEVEVKGEDALRFIQKLVTNDVTLLKDNQVLYTLMCYQDGGVVDDLLVYRFDKNNFFLVINAGNIEKDFEWMLSNKDNFDISLINISQSISQLAIQGPKAESILQKLTDMPLKDIKFFFCKREVLINGKKCLVSRTGYTGEDGFELYTDTENSVDLWDEILAAGKEDGLKPVGLGARDTLRFEVNLPLYGNELSKYITPLEADLGIFVKLNKEDFIGKSALIKQKQEGLSQKLVGFEMKSKSIPRHGYEVFIGEEKVGVVTTGYLSPSLKKNIGLALIDTKYCELGTTIFIKIRNKLNEAVVVDKKFYKKNYNK
ncbi:glycine cleavage system aminomethyltransferase GcvT [Clostridium thailandense]|uniref:Aminomethyltransferase n=1 Tax=Clostridium thailandense TaxID=2794346 RepID=A0A949TLJ4_9CLOT|nr:glycine cleavage system aminomethyltransferase GcvT [Clostridium thailandense]MBV7272687.1 glycine cleavage system aminomethyltransferase GcvT [Clostridium thailandense]MCH5137856.1 glycine cleavage system aminomethyltransferase GcvT [Clostridiaceae bacterium UIB06]